MITAREKINPRIAEQMDKAGSLAQPAGPGSWEEIPERLRLAAPLTIIAPMASTTTRAGTRTSRTILAQ